MQGGTGRISVSGRFPAYPVLTSSPKVTRSVPAMGARQCDRTAVMVSRDHAAHTSAGDFHAGCRVEPGDTAPAPSRLPNGEDVHLTARDANRTHPLRCCTRGSGRVQPTHHARSRARLAIICTFDALRMSVPIVSDRDVAPCPSRQPGRSCPWEHRRGLDVAQAVDAICSSEPATVGARR
jgi:hypothetical protein